MHAQKRFSALPNLVIALLLASFSLGAWASPVVKKVDPPNWWAGLPNPMLLISGEDFGGASVKASAGAGIRKVEVESTGHYIFVWPDFAKSKPGRIIFTVTTPRGSTEISFELSARQPKAAGFQGFGQDDVIYLIMPTDLPTAIPVTTGRHIPTRYTIAVNRRRITAGTLRESGST